MQTNLLEVHSYYRHPGATSRPGFRDIVMHMMRPESEMLEIPQEALNTNTLAGVLGGPLKAGINMYCDLQWAYFSPSGDEITV